MPSSVALTELDRLRLELDAQEAEMALLRRRVAAAESMARATSDATWDWDLARQEITWSAAMEAVYGYPPGQVGRATAWWFEHVHPDDRNRIETGLREALGGDAVEWTGEYRFQRADGSYAHVRDYGFVLRSEVGQAERMVGAMQDLSWRRPVEEGLALKAESLRLATEMAELRRSEAGLRLIVDAVPVLIGFVDPGMIYRFVNRAVVDWMGLLPEQVVGRLVPEIVGEVGFAARKPYMERALAGEAVTVEADWPCQNGEPRVAELRYLPRRDAAGEISGFHVFVMDITDRRTTERALRGTTETLVNEVESRTQALVRTEDALRQSQKMEAVGQLTGGLAHDFNNLLTGITGSLELMQTRIRQGRVGELDRYIAAAQGAAQRAAGLTHRLLAFSRRQTLDPKPTDVSRLVMGMEELIRRTVGPSVDIEAVGPEQPWHTLCDPNQLENALLNLAINARDAMPDGGRLVIEVQNTWLDARAAGLRDLAAGGYVLLSVTDTGSGMAPEVLERAFDPFFTTKPLGQGTGLGLSMIYGFARQSGGQVRIHSQPGQGTTVTILLPRFLGEAVGEVEVASLPSDVPRAEAGETVLVVDDDGAVRMLVAEVLADLGYAALEAGDGASGLAVLQSGVRVDLLVTDVGLPGGMNGRQLADAARVGRPELRVLFITGYAEAAVAGQDGLEPGMQVLTKPFAMDALATRIRQMITG